MKKRSRLNSVAVSSTGVAAAVDLVPVLVEDEILEPEHVAGQSSPAVRRRIAWIRATISARLNGFVT